MDIKIDEFEYTLSNEGILKNKLNKIIKPQINKNGYCVVNLYKNNKRKAFYLHKLVAKYFLKNYDENKTINHIDGNKLNNNVSNLECITYSENLKHSYDYLKRPVNKSSGYKKVKIYKNEKFICESRSIDNASRISNVSSTQIRRLINNGKVSKNGFKFILSVEDIEKVDKD